MSTEETLMQDLANAVVEMDESKAAELAEASLGLGIDPYQAIHQGLAVGMNIVGEKYEKEEYFIPELLLCSDAMYAGLNILKPALKKDTTNTLGKIVIGVVEGDTHDIGKSLVQMMLEASGFDVVDLGRDVPINRFIEAAKEHGAQMICLSTLMSTTMEGMHELIKRLEAEGSRNQFKIVIGGGAVTPSFCEKIGADGYSSDAAKAVHLIKGIFKTINNEEI